MKPCGNERNNMIKVIYEDNHLLVVDKPAGIPTQPTAQSQDSLEEQAKSWIKAKHNKPGKVFLHAIHRLDKSASGIVVFAKTSKALSRLNDAIRQKAIKKWYLAWVEGIPHPHTGTLEHYLIHDDFKASVVHSSAKGAKLARLHYQMIKHDEHQSLLEIELETGRYHQIRAQLAAIGCPILGDIKYGSQQKLKSGIALHHTKMTVPHPTTGEPLSLESLPKWDYQSVI